MRPFISLCLFIFTALLSSAQEETGNSNTAFVTPFTGSDFVRVVVHKDQIAPSADKFAVTIQSPENQILWKGNVSLAPAANEGGNHLSFTIKDLNPVLWTPTDPFMYEIVFQQIKKGAIIKTMKERLGFRSFSRKGNQLLLNGKPIFLRGIAINPPNRGIPETLEKSRGFALEYVRFMKSLNVNIIRIPDDETWYDVCDELGMMVFGGNYGGKVAGGEKVESEARVGDETDGGFPSDFDKGVAWYENEKLGPYAHHPSLMVYALTNETPFAGTRAVQWEKFLDYAFQALRKWDETRVYIANAGYGYGKTGDITDLHRYWGWYYSSPFTFLNIRDEALINPFAGSHKPLTFTECVGNYTGPDGRYNLTPAHKNPSSQLAWTGHAAQEYQAQLADCHQSFTFRQATETFRQLRRVNPDLSGIFPFTILFYNWNTINSFTDMGPKPVTKQVRTSYQPVLLSWECWTPQVFAGSIIRPIAHIINDDNEFRDLKEVKLIYELRDKAQFVLLSDTVKMADIPYYVTSRSLLDIKLPANLASGNYQLIGTVMSQGEQVSQNFYNLFIAGERFLPAASFDASKIYLYDISGDSKRALSQLGINYSPVSSFTKLSPHSVLIIGENSADNEISGQSALIQKFVASGGKIVCLRQDSIHMANVNSILVNPLVNNNIDIDNPVYPVSAKSPRNGYYVNPERESHPIFEGITRAHLRVWSDYTNWDETKKGFPAIKPVTDGFNLQERDDVAQTAILANYSSGLQAIALAEQFQGKGSILLCGLDIARRTSLDPIAARLLLNMLNYATSDEGHERYQLITSPVIWGEYETEKGIVTDLYSGFLVNSTPRVAPDYLGKGIVVTKEGYQLAGGNRSGFNSRPGIQYVANGRRPFGPFVQSFGGQPIPDKDTAEGTGKFWCRIPEGQNMASSLVWNPGDEALTIRIKVNGLPEVHHTISPGERVSVKTPVDSSNVNITYMGDRRLVILETAFFRSAKKYFVDALQGNDGNSGTDMTTPWKSLSKVSAFPFQPGDEISFKSGQKFTGTLTVSSSGKEGEPIIYTSYGGKEPATIDGDGDSTAIWVHNKEYIEFKNLAVTNFRKGEIKGDDLFNGIYIVNQDAGTLNHIHLDAVRVFNVNSTHIAKDEGKTDQSRYHGGVQFRTIGNKVRSNFNDVLVSNSVFENLSRTGFNFRSDWDDRSAYSKFGDKLPNGLTDNWTPNTGVIFRKNIFRDIAGNGLIVRVAVNALIENNLFDTCGKLISGNAVFNFNTDHTVYQFNEARNTVYSEGETDARGIDSDYRTKHTIIQHNYLHHNGLGGVIATGGPGIGDDPVNFNLGTIIRYNIIENNDRQGVYASGRVEGMVVHNNVFYADKDHKDVLAVKLNRWTVYPNGVTFKNNIFFFEGDNPGYDFTQATNVSFDHNLYYGIKPPELFPDASPVVANPDFFSPGSGPAGYRLRAGSPAIGAGIGLENNAGIN
jgi:hypothetical protein